MPPSAGSSYVVADVEYESWAEELRLCVGDAMLVSPSDVLIPATLKTDLPSALPFRRLGALPPICPTLGVARGARGFLTGVANPGKGLAGTLDIRLGGWGNELILTVFLIVLPALLTAGGPLGVGRAVVGAGEGGGPVRTLADGARKPLFGVVGLAVGVAEPEVDFRGFGRGKAGKEELGGPFEGRDLGKVVVMATRMDHPGG